MYQKLAAISALVAAVRAQQVCTLQAETHPSMTWSTCAAGGTCTSQTGQVVIDANWRWTHALSSTTNCYTGNTWDTTLCPDDVTGAANCCLDGALYGTTYGATTSGNALTLKFVTTTSTGTNIGSRLYLMASNTAYQMFTLLGNEFTFDVDVSQLPCGLNGALYFVSMDADGGLAKYPTNKAGAQYGTGYCDSQCPRDLKFINGEANCEGWEASTNDKNAGIGNHGSCCAEMDIWEANSISNAVTPHPCTTYSQHMCTGDACGGTYSTDRYAGDCDPDGCDFNPYRMGNTTFYGPGMTIDTTQKFTVVTQFQETGGVLSSINRFYVQNGVVIANSQSTISGVTGNAITEAFCDAQKTAFGDTNDFDSKGGMSGMSTALANPMVLVMSLWDDHAVDMLWLDSTYPVGGTSPGDFRGTCATSSGVPSEVEADYPNSQVIYSNIKFGPIGSTFNQPGSGSSSSSTAKTSTTSTKTSSTTLKTSTTTTKTTTTKTTTSSASGCTQTHYGQCAGIGYTGCTICASGTTCQYSNDYYSQCL